MRDISNYLAHSINNRVYVINDSSEYLAHYQVLGAKHGVRRYQNEDGSLTPLGRIHYGVGPPRDASKEDGKGKTNINIAGGVTSASTVNKPNAKITINGKDAEQISGSIKNKIQEISEKRREKALAKALAKNEQRKEKEEKAERDRLVEEAKKEAEAKAAEEAERDHQAAQIKALKEYYREHPLQIYSARDLLSPEDIKDVEKQIVFDRQLKDFRRDELMRYVDTAKDVVTALDTVYKGADNLKKIYNIGAESYNALIAAKDPNDKKKPLRIIGNEKFTPKTPSDASTDKKANKKSVKPDYIDKVELNNGQTRYFYDKDELKAYKEAQSGIAKKAVEAYKKSSPSEQKAFNKEMADIMARRVDEGTWDSVSNAKKDAIYDALKNYTYDVNQTDKRSKLK